MIARRLIGTSAAVVVAAAWLYMAFGWGHFGNIALAIGNGFVGGTTSMAILARTWLKKPQGS